MNKLSIPLNVKEKKTLHNSNNKSFGISASKENKDFFSIVSHNIKNPFTTLLGFSDLLIEDYESLSEDERKFYLKEIIESANFTNKYLERFFEWIYYKTGKAQVVIEELDLVEVIEEATNLISGKHNFPIISLNKTGSIKIKADRDSAVKAFYYILENAVLHSETKTNILINYGFDNNNAIISITDCGKGISEEHKNNLFRVDVDITLLGRNRNKGTGLGLILTKQFIDLNEGSIRINSEIGEGTEVVINLPLSQKLN